MLQPDQKEAIKKMSTERITNKLRKLGYKEDEVSTLSREELLRWWAEAVLTGEDKASVVLTTATDVSSKASNEVERERIEWEKFKWFRRNKGEKVAERSRGCSETKRIGLKRKRNCAE
jgi:hypothetical protein